MGGATIDVINWVLSGGSQSDLKTLKNSEILDSILVSLLGKAVGFEPCWVEGRPLVTQRLTPCEWTQDPSQVGLEHQILTWLWTNGLYWDPKPEPGRLRLGVLGALGFSQDL